MMKGARVPLPQGIEEIYERVDLREGEIGIEREIETEREREIRSKREDCERERSEESGSERGMEKEIGTEREKSERRDYYLEISTSKTCPEIGGRKRIYKLQEVNSNRLTC